MAGRADKFCYECATVLPRTAVTCWSCKAEQPLLPESSHGAPSRPAGSERACEACGAAILARAEICVHCGVRQQALPALEPLAAPLPAAPPAAARAPAPARAAAPAAPAHSELGRDHWDASHVLLAVAALTVMALGAASRKSDPPAVTPASASASVSPKPTPSPEITETQAWAEARRQVTTHLRAPPNVAFANEHRTVRLGPARFEVTSHFEMHNTSGALVRTFWTVQIAKVHGRWTVERLEARN